MASSYPESSTSVNPSVVPPLASVPNPAPDDGPSRLQARLTKRRKLSMGLDTLRLSFKVSWSFLEIRSEYLLFRQLEDAKTFAQEKDIPSFPVSLAGYEWNVQRAGTKDFTFKLVRGDVCFLLNRRRVDDQRPNVRFEIGSMSCWSPGYQAVYDEFIKMVEFLGGAVIDETVSEAHLTADAIGCPIISVLPEVRWPWISRAKKFSSHTDGAKFSGITLGEDGVQLRVYDKGLEMRGKKNSQKQALFADVWGLDRYNERSVTRVEFELRRDFLRENKVRSLSDLCKSMNSIWQYLTGSWARLASSAPDRKNRHQDRVKVSPFWSFIQSAQFSGERTVNRVKQYFRKDINRLVSMASGCIMSIAAMTGDIFSDVEGSLVSAQELLSRNLLSAMQFNKPDFNRKLYVKYNEAFGLPISANAPF